MPLQTKDIKTGDIIFVKDNSLLAKIIMYITKSQYVHCGIVYDVNQYGVWIAEINYSYSFSIRKMEYTNYEVYRCREPINEIKIKETIRDMVGLKYDFRDIFRIVFGLPMKYTPKRVICSESVMYVYESLGIKLTDKKVPTPEDLVSGGMLEMV